MTNPSLKLRALRGAIWAAIGGNGAQVLSFVMFVLISRVVGPAAFGAVAICLLLVEIARAITSECIAVNLVASGRYNAQEFNAGFVLSLSLAVGVSILLAASAPLAAFAFKTPALEQVLPQLAPLVAAHALARLYEAEMTLRMAFRALAFRALAAVTLGGAAGIASAYAGHGVEALVLQQWVAALASLYLLAVQAHWRPGLTFGRDVMSSLARQSAAMAPAGVITNVRHTFDGLAVASFAGPAAAGVYNLAKRTRLALQIGFTSAIGRVTLPAFAQVKEDPQRLAAAMRDAMRLSAIVAFPIFIGVAAVAPELIEAFLGAEWRAAAAPMTLLMIGGALAIATRLCDNLLLACGKRATIIGLNAFALTLLVTLVLLVGAGGPVAVAGAVLSAGIAHNIAAWMNAARCAPLRTRDYLGAVWAPLLICVAMAGLLAALREADPFAHLTVPIRLAAFIAIGGLFYFAGAWLFVRPGVRAALSATRMILAAPAANP